MISKAYVLNNSFVWKSSKHSSHRHEIFGMQICMLVQLTPEYFLYVVVEVIWRDFWYITIESSCSNIYRIFATSKCYNFLHNSSNDIVWFWESNIDLKTHYAILFFLILISKFLKIATSSHNSTHKLTLKTCCLCY